jgi:hypothetical protein
MMFSHLLAMADMRGNLIAAGVVLAFGLVLLRLLSPNSVRSKSHIWVSVVALIAGPIVGIVWWALDVFVLAPELYIFPSDYLEVLPPILLIGTFVGVIAALAFALAYRVRLPKGR